MSSSKCEPCPSACTSCFSNSFCTSCKIGFHLLKRSSTAQFCVRHCIENKEYFDGIKCSLCTDCPICQVKRELFCSECPKCQRKCEINVSTNESGTVISISTPQIKLDSSYLKKKYSQFVRILEISKDSFNLVWSNFKEEVFFDFEIDLESILQANCLFLKSIVVPIYLKRKSSRFLGSTIGTINTILSSIETLSVFAYFKMNFSFIIIDLINKNKLFMYSFGLEPHLTSFALDFNLFIISGNYKSNDVFFVNYFGLTTIEKVKEVNLMLLSVGSRIKEFYFEEVELLELVEIIFFIVLILLRIFYKIAQFLKDLPSKLICKNDSL